MSDQSCDGNDRLFYLNDDGKLELFYIQKIAKTKEFCSFH